MKKINVNIHQKNSILYLIIYGGIILIIFLVGILPYYLKISNQEKENDKIRYQIKEQKALGPIYKALMSSDENQDSLVLPNPEKTSLPRSAMQNFQTDFQVVAKKSGIKIVSFTPDINTSSGSSTSCLHNVVLKGEWADFRRILMELGSIPYLERIEEINIQQNTGSMDFKLKVWIAIN